MKATDIFNMLVQSGLFAVLLGLVVSGIKCAKTYIDAKTAECAARVKNEKTRDYITNAEKSVSTVVLDLSQTLVDDLKAKAADGKLTQEEINQVQDTAIQKVQTLITTDGFAALDETFGNADTWIKSKIEAEVKKMKSPAVPQA